MELIAFRPLRNASFVSLLFTSFAVAQLIQGAFRQTVSVRSKGIPVPAFFDEAVQIGPVRISVLSMITAAIGAISLVALTAVHAPVAVGPGDAGGLERLHDGAG